jgi:drug/metabolite transporter (DMT)-like permease
MEIAILLSLAASFCTATASVCQRLGARQLDHVGNQRVGEHRVGNQHSRGFDPWLVFRLAGRPVWLLGFLGMLAGFAFQVSALHFGPLALVQPILAVELLLVFGYLAVRAGRSGAGPREWGAAVAMSAGIIVFLRAAAPAGGSPHAPALLWWVSGLAVAAAVTLAIAAAAGGSPTRRAACLGIATGMAWGFVAAVIKELSSHVSGGPSAVFAGWSAYVLMVTGAAAMLLASHAMAAGPLAASQPGFTIGDPVTAVLLGVFLFGEHLQTSPAALAGEVLGLAVLGVGVWILSRSRLIVAAEEAGASEQDTPGLTESAC